MIQKMRFSVLMITVCAVFGNSIAHADFIDDQQKAAKQRRLLKRINAAKNAHYNEIKKIDRENERAMQAAKNKTIVSNQPVVPTVASQHTTSVSVKNSATSVPTSTLNNSTTVRVEQTKAVPTKLSALKQALQEKYKHLTTVIPTYAQDAKEYIVGQVKEHPYAVAAGIATALAYETGMLKKIENILKKMSGKHAAAYVKARGYLLAGICMLAGIAAVTVTDIAPYTESAVLYVTSALTTVGVSRLAQLIYNKLIASKTECTATKLCTL